MQFFSYSLINTHSYSYVYCIPWPTWVNILFRIQPSEFAATQLDLQSYLDAGGIVTDYKRADHFDHFEYEKSV